MLNRCMELNGYFSLSVEVNTGIFFFFFVILFFFLFFQHCTYNGVFWPSWKSLSVYCCLWWFTPQKQRKFTFPFSEWATGEHRTVQALVITGVTLSPSWLCWLFCQGNRASLNIYAVLRFNAYLWNKLGSGLDWASKSKEACYMSKFVWRPDTNLVTVSHGEALNAPADGERKIST